jgi:hypothetical protein
MDWKIKIKRFYDERLWTIEQVKKAVTYNKLTEAEFEEITGQDYATT